MAPAVAVPTFDGKGSPSASYQQEVALLPQVTPLEPGRKAAALPCQMSDVARQVCMISGNGHIMNNDGAQQILSMSRDHPAPDAVRAIYSEVVRFMHFKRTGHTMDAFLLESEVLRHEAEARMAIGGGRREEFVAILWAQDASLSKNGKSLVLDTVQGALAFAAPVNRMRRLFGSCGSAARRDVLVAADADFSSEDVSVPQGKQRTKIREEGSE